MSLVLAAVGAAVAALIQATVLPFAAAGGGGLDLVLVIAVVWTMALGLEGGLVWAFLGGLVIDVLLMRPLGLTAFIDLLAVGAAWVIGRLFARASIRSIVVTAAVLAAIAGPLTVVALPGPARRARRASIPWPAWRPRRSSRRSSPPSSRPLRSPSHGAARVEEAERVDW